MVLHYLPPSTAELVLATFLAVGTERLVTLLWESHLFGLFQKDRTAEQINIRSTLFFGITHSVALSARAFLGLWAAEQIMDRFPIIRKFSLSDDSISLSEAAPSITLTLWTGLTLCTIKRVILMRTVSGKRLGRVALFDHLLDFIIFLLTFLNVLDKLKIDLSVGIQSILSAGGIGALVFSLASKDLAEQIVGGFSLNAWEALDIGDRVRLGDGTEGTVLEIGLVETLIKGYDNIVTRIPNSQLTSARISNLSRVKQSRLKQMLRYKYSDIDKLPALFADIKEEVRLSCPKLVTKGKSFHVVIKSYEPDHISCFAQAHFDIQPATSESINNRQEFLLAINRSMQRHKISFALPAMIYHGPEDVGGAVNSEK